MNCLKLVAICDGNRVRVQLWREKFDMSSTLLWQDLIFYITSVGWKLARATQMPGVCMGKWKGWEVGENIWASRFPQVENLVRTQVQWVTGCH